MNTKKNKNKKRTNLIYAVVVPISLLLILGFFAIVIMFVLKSFSSNLQTNFAIDEKNKISYNVKYSENNKISKDYKFDELFFEEYPYAKDSKGNYKYFFNKEGLELLSKEFKRRANFGPEIFEIQKISINKRYSNNAGQDVNGLYNPETKEIILFTTELTKARNGYQKSWDTVDLNKKVEMVLPTLVHEYTHHIANVYNNSGKNIDNNYTTNYYYKLAENSFNFYKDILIKNYTNNTKFIDGIKKYLYNENYKSYESYLLDAISNNSIFKNFSAYDLFNFANTKSSNLSYADKLKWQNFENKEYYFNNPNPYLSIRFASPITEDRIDYLYSIEELIAREFVKLTYTNSKTIYNPYSSLFENIAYFKKENGYFISSFGDDILKNIANAQSLHNLEIVSTNWVFDNELRKYKKLVRQSFPLQNGYSLPFKSLPTNENVKGLYKTYMDLMGYGLPICYFSYNQYNQFNDVVLGGYLKLDNPYKNIYLVASNSIKEENIKLNVFKANTIVKTKWQSFFEDTNSDVSLINQDKTLYSYVTDPLAISKLTSLNDSTFNFKFWIDKNNNGQKDSNEIVEIASANFYARQEEIKRSVINIRKYIENNNITLGLKNSYKISIKKIDTSGDIKYQYVLEKY